MSRTSAVKKRGARSAARRGGGKAAARAKPGKRGAAPRPARKSAKSHAAKAARPAPAKPAAPARAASTGQAKPASGPVAALPLRSAVLVPPPTRPAVIPSAAPVYGETTGREAPPVAPARQANIPRPPPRPRVSRAGVSEEDLLRAPQSQYMNAQQLAFFRERLLDMQRELLEKADLTSEHLRAHEIEPDPTDQATIEEEYALELRTRDRERKLLKKIDEALKRIDDGSYGYCEETGEPIGIPRLLARPTATLSVEAQARRELKQKLYGD